MAVLFGGDSSEREISLLSGNAVLEALKSRGVDAQAFDPRDLPLSDLIAARFERVWIALRKNLRDIELSGLIGDSPVGFPTHLQASGSRITIRDGRCAPM